MYYSPTLAQVAVINTDINILWASSWSIFLGLSVWFPHLTCSFNPSRMNLLQLWWCSGKILLIMKKGEERGWWNGERKGRIIALFMREMRDPDHKHLILLRIQLKALLSNDWYFPVSNQTWAEQNLWWKNITELQKYMIEEIIHAFALNPLMVLK